MEKIAKLVSRTPPEGLTEWAPVRDDLERWGLVYEAVWVPDGGLEFLLDEGARPRKVKAVEVRCSCCGESRIMRWSETDKQHGGYGFLHENERSGETALIGSGDESVCPICGAPVLVRKAADIGRGYFVADETSVMSAAVAGNEKYLALTCWTIQRRVYRNATAELKVIPAEAYVFGQKDCRKLMGWRNSYSGTAGYFISYSSAWSEPEKWSESWGSTGGIYGLTAELVAGSCLPNCKLDVYMESFRGSCRKYPVMYLRLYQLRPHVENLLVSGLPMVLHDLLGEARNLTHGEGARQGIPECPSIGEIHWTEIRPARMLGLDKDELRLAREQGWGLFLWRLFVRTKAHGERLTGEDIRNAFRLGDEGVLSLPGQGPVGKSLRYLLRQIERAGHIADPDLIPEESVDAAMLLDYWRMSRELGRNLEDRQVRWPRDLIEAHDAVAEEYRRLQDRKEMTELAAAFRVRRRLLARYIFEADGLKIVPAYSQADLRKEGDMLHHCVASYALKHAKGNAAIFFIRRTVEPGKPYYTLELDEKGLTVRQNRGLRNCGKTPEVQAFEDLWIAWVRAGARRDEHGKPVLPERKERARISA